MRSLAIALFLVMVFGSSPAMAEDTDPNLRLNQISVGFFLGGFLASDDHEVYNFETSVQKELNPVSADLECALDSYRFHLWKAREANRRVEFKIVQD